MISLLSTFGGVDPMAGGGGGAGEGAPGAWANIRVLKDRQRPVTVTALMRNDFIADNF